MVLVDAPPILAGVDADNIAINCDAVLLVVEAHRPFAAAVREAVEDMHLHGVPILGGVLVKVLPGYSSLV